MPQAADVLAPASGEHPHPWPPHQTEGRILEDLRWLSEEKLDKISNELQPTHTSPNTPRWLPQLFVVYSNTMRNVFYRFQFTEGSQLVKLIQIYVADNQVSTSSGRRRRVERDYRTLVLSSKRPLGVRSMRLGGRNGYSAGSSNRQW